MNMTKDELTLLFLISGFLTVIIGMWFDIFPGQIYLSLVVQIIIYKIINKKCQKK